MIELAKQFPDVIISLKVGELIETANSGDTHPLIPVIGTHFLCYDSLITLPKLPFFS